VVIVNKAQTIFKNEYYDNSNIVSNGQQSPVGLMLGLSRTARQPWNFWIIA